MGIGGGELSVWDTGDGVPLVFIHGAATTGGLWAQDLEPLATQCRVLVYDRRGYGESSASPRSWAAHREDAAALIDALKASGGVLVGYSAGASIALDLVLHRPDIAAALVLVEPAVNLERCITFGMVRALVTARLVRKLRGDRAGAESWIRYVAGYSTGGTAFDKASPERRETLLANAAGLFADSDAGLPQLDEARFSQIRMPVTLITAASSQAPFRKSCARLKARLPHARVVTLPNAGHHVTVDARDALLAELRRALPDGRAASAR